MFYELSKNQNVFIELTNIVHGGPGWELGTCLWSPSKSRDNKDVWKCMRDVQKGDLIIHSIKTNKGHKFIGASIVESTYSVTDVEPTYAGRWSNMESYYRIELLNYKNFDKSIFIKEFLNQYAKDLSNFKETFYTVKLEPAQKYLVRLEYEQFKMLNDFLDKKDIYYKEKLPLPNDEKQNDQSGDGSSKRESVILSRIVRDSKIVKELKEQFNHTCQICGKSISIPGNKKYSEGHHLRPLGGIHEGPDIKSNIIILCSDHHTEFDYGSIAINPKTNKVVHIDEDNILNGKRIAYKRDDLDIEYIKYHYSKIYNKSK